MSLNAKFGSDNDEQFKKAFLGGEDSYLEWGAYIVGSFHRHRIMHLINEDLAYHPHTIAVAVALEHMHWKHKVDELVTKTMKSKGVTQTALYLPINYSPPPPRAEDGKIYAEDGSELSPSKITKLKQTWDKEQKELQSVNEVERREYITLLATSRDEEERYLIGEAKGLVFADIKRSIHADYNSAIQQVDYGDAPGLLLQIDLFMKKESGGRLKVLLKSFMDSTFENEGKSDLQQWINYLASNHA